MASVLSAGSIPSSTVLRRRPERNRSVSATRPGSTAGVAVANAKLAYQSYQRMLASPRWKALAEKGRRRSACCGPTRGPRIRRMIGPDTVNTVPPATLAAFRDHGSAHPR